MKKLICSIILVFGYLMTVNAQIPDGFYHIKNTGTGRYVSISDTNPNNYQVSQAGNVNMAGIRTFLNYDTVAVSPSCVIYVKQLGNGKYDFEAQGSSLYAMTSYKLPVDITPAGGSYIISGTYSGITKELADLDSEDEEGWLASNESPMRFWNFIPIDTSSEFIGIRPDVKTATGSYWGTIRAGFSFRLASPGMAAYGISMAGGTGFTMEPIDQDVIPAGAPVIIRCNSENIEDNKIEPVLGGYTEYPDWNWLKGVYCSIDVTKHKNVELFDRITMRILGLSDEGELAFVANPPIERLYISRQNEKCLMANKAYLAVDANAADVMTLGGYTPEAINSVKSDCKSTGIYTLTGSRLPDGVTPRAGIYVKNGRKVIIK